MSKFFPYIMRPYGLPRPAAERLYRHLWIYIHGIVCLCAAKIYRFENAEIQRMMSEMFLNLLGKMKE